MAIELTEVGKDKIDIRLQAKSGERFDTSQIATCLEHTIAKADSK